MAPDELSAPQPAAVGPSAAVDMRGLSIVILAGSVGLFILHEGADLFVPVLLSVLLAYVLEPPLALLMRAGLPRVAAAVMLFAIAAIALGAGARSTRDQVVAFLDDIPDTIASIKRLGNHKQPTQAGLLDRLQKEARALHETLIRQAPPPAPGVVRVMPVKRFDFNGYVGELGRGAIAGTIRAGAVALLTFLLLATGDLYKQKLVRLAGPTLARRRLTIDVLRTIDRQITRFLGVRLLTSIVVAAATALPLWWLGLSHAVIWGVIAGVLNILPFVGPTATVALIGLAAFVQFQTLEMTAAAVGIATVVGILEGNLLSPWLTGQACELNTVAVFVSVLFWGWVWGVWGLLLAIPIMVTIKAAADHIEALQPLRELLGR
jgi:predicted PurR-regulated permease PerM